MLENYGKQSPAGVEAVKQGLAALNPIGHIGEPNDIAYI